MEGLSVLMPVGGAVDTDPWRKRAFDWLMQRYAEIPYDIDIEMAFGTSDQVPYNRAQARNDAFSAATGDVLLVADADTVYHPAALQIAVGMVRSGGVPWVIPYAEGRYYNLSQDATDFMLNTGPAHVVPEPPTPDEYGTYEHKITSWAGLLVLSRESWEKAGGYDETFRGWGYEDNAFRYALDHAVGSHVRVRGSSAYAMHLWHPVTEAECFGQPDIEHNRELCRQYELGLLPA